VRARGDPRGRHGGLLFASTGLSVAEHQAPTVANYLQLRDLALDLPFIPVLQGWTLADYILRTIDDLGAILQTGRGSTGPRIAGTGLDDSVVASRIGIKVSGPNRTSVGSGACQHGFSEVESAHVRSPQIGTPKIRSSKICALQEGASEVRLHQRCLGEISASKIRILQVAAVELDSAQPGPSQVGVPKLCVSQPGPSSWTPRRSTRDR